MKRILMTAAIATAFTASPTMAAIYSSASLSNYKVSLVDLDSEDGITPSITFRPGFDYLYGFVSGANSADPYLAADQNITPISKTSTDTINTATSSITGNTFDSVELQVSGSSLEQQPSVEGYKYFASATKSHYFTLSANTRVNFTLNTLNYMETTSGTGGNTFAYTHSYLEARGYNLRDEVIINSNNDYDGINFEAVKINPSDYNFAILNIMSVILDNNYHSELFGFVYSGGSTGTSLTAPPPSTVPVPAALPLMASALGLFGLGAKRRKALKV